VGDGLDVVVALEVAACDRALEEGVTGRAACDGAGSACTAAGATTASTGTVSAVVMFTGARADDAALASTADPATVAAVAEGSDGERFLLV
jgi:hypothetical protein